MPISEFIIPISVFLINIMIGFLIYVRNPHLNLNKLFLLLSLSISIWSTSSALSDIVVNDKFVSIFSHLAFSFGFLLLIPAYFFASCLLGKKLNTKFNFCFLVVGLVLSVLFATDLVYAVDLTGQGINGPLYGFYIFSLIIYFALVIWNFLYGLGDKTIQQKAQVKTVFIGFAIPSVLVLFSNAILPSISELSWTTRIGPYFTVIFVAFTAYAIQRHGLFDLRLVVARSLAYLLSLGLVTGIVALLIFVLSESVRDTQISETVQSWIYVTVTLILVLSYPSLKRFFDRVTNSLFYRDAYDAEQFIGQLNQVVVTDIEIYSLLRKVVSVIEKNLKVTYCAFATVNHDGGVVLVSDDPDERQDLTKLDIKLLKDIDKARQVVVTDYLDEQKDIKLKQHLSDLDLGGVVSLVSKKSNEPQQFTKVYMVLGLKKSGNPFTSQDVRVLGIISDSLALAIQNALRFEEISRFNITLQEKIDEATRELKRTNEKLKALDEAKDEFISMASHQLRTPLTSVKGYVSMVLEGDTGAIKEDQRKLLQQAFDSSQRMVYLIADLLNVSRLRTGKFVIENKPTNLIEVVQGEVDQLKETASNKQITLSYEKPDKIPEMMLDETKIRQVIMNFLDNALYYTPSGGEVKVALKKAGESVEYTVTDTGVGVPKSEQHHLFTKFFRAGNARKMRPDGTGLGLYMAQKVVVAQGGAIIFNSEEGKGSTFGFKFPIKPKPSSQPITDNGEDE